MKRKILGLMAIVLALSLSAFNARPVYQKFVSYWWFPQDAATGEVHSVPTLIYQSFDPYECNNWGDYGYCAGAWNSYTGNYGEYWPWGTQVLQDYHEFP